MSTNISNKQLQDLLKALERFGFKFYGYNESREPLVLAPNGQITSVLVAYNFVKDQIAKQKMQNATGSGLGSLESINFSDITPEKIETNLENNVEKSIEKSQETTYKKDGSNMGSSVYPSSKQSNDEKKGSSKVGEIPVPFSFGFSPKNFNPTSVQETLDFIKTAKVEDITSSSKWLSVQFQKWLEEYQKR